MTAFARWRGAVARHWRRLAGAVLALAVAVAIATSGELHGAVTRAFAAAGPVMGAHPLAGPVVFVALAALSAMVAFFSSAVLVPPAVLAWGSARAGVLLWLGWLLGGVAAYAVGRWLGRPVVRWLVPAEQFGRYERRIVGRASLAGLVLFQMALPSEVPGYVVGVLRLPLARYLLALGIAELPFAAGAVLLGRSFLRGDTLRMLAVGLAVIAVAAAAVLAWQRRTASRPA
jgi:uncharacterized membrane protein YdjX (TVP38/TMEM64 family)